MRPSSRGFRDLITPAEDTPGVHQVTHNEDGRIVVWALPGPRGSAHHWRVTIIDPNGTIRQGTGPYDKDAWAAAHAAVQPEA
jgi:hypothetical protein